MYHDANEARSKSAFEQEAEARAQFTVVPSKVMIRGVMIRNMKRGRISMTVCKPNAPTNDCGAPISHTPRPYSDHNLPIDLSQASGSLFAYTVTKRYLVSYVLLDKRKGSRSPAKGREPVTK